MNWVGLLSIAVSLLTLLTGATLKQFFDLRKEIAELRVDHQKLLNSVAEKYVRSPDFAEFKLAMQQQFSGIRSDISELTRSVSGMTGLIHELKGAVQANNPPRS